jgi:hypothetical protein
MITLYFMHDTLTPENVRASMQADVVPPVGAIVRLPCAGYDGAPAFWKVADQEWVWVPDSLPPSEYAEARGTWSVTLFCTDVPIKEG